MIWNRPPEKQTTITFYDGNGVQQIFVDFHDKDIQFV